ncbi:energy transducer TonB [Flavobacterium aquidurense]|jgi:outer membrane receptor protein involved in Fe transport|uniref:TonB-dependent receptor n=1 Tax=Flavobacterium aquidurense TaxID=362413 RepID=UPI0009195435|nr:TonB-dependent receptor [Flavobacterium aquidurense]OXA69750.1 energy transducer TonB [Flavobacterium aquidurense]SHH27147.1 Outer membrane receptor proteins, mostly Fe transport [Flavobacterium frigidimaris]
MTTHKFLFFSIFFFFSILSHSQQNQGFSVSGEVTENSGQTIPYATIIIEKTDLSIISDENGKFIFKNVKSGKHILKISAIGFATQKKHIEVSGKDLNFSLRLESELNVLESVTVMGRTATDKVNKQAYSVTAIDAKKLHNTTLDLSHALDRVSGVRVREQGGVGSQSELSINGFSGNQIKVFIDGIPMDNFGSSFQLNNIPINLADRVEVYKGVVPIWLGGDALGGAVNIVTNSKPRTYFDASYSFGSFNTHKTSINAGYTAKSGFTTEINAFQNYSDNNYWVNVEAADLKTGEYFPNARVRRFHDTYHNETVIVNIGITGKKYADKLLFGFTGGQNKADIQTGARMKSVFGSRYTQGNILMPTLKYQVKDLFTKGLNLNVNANYNFGEEQTVDTVFRKYNWFGDYIQYNGLGGEKGRTLMKLKDNNGIATANATYSLGERHSFMLNNTFTTFDRKQEDELVPESVLYQQPRKTQKNILGLGYKFDYNEKWSTSVFLKDYNLKTNYSRSYNPSGNAGDIAYQKFNDNSSNLGYGFASSYYLRPNFQVKGSFEKSYRLPSSRELFGNPNENAFGNIDLKPESSYNYNLGFSYQTNFNKVHALTFDMNVMYRDAKDFIRSTLYTNQVDTYTVNLGKMTNYGVDGEVRYSYRNRFTAGFNMTYQNLRNMTKYEPDQNYVSAFYKDRIPNIPYMFGNFDATAFFNDLFKKGNNLSVGYNLLYVHTYYLSWPSMGSKDSKLEIPKQFNHDLNVVYTMANGKYNIAFECKNVFDNKLYDNFSLQKPSRAFYIKFRYFFNKSN